MSDLRTLLGGVAGAAGAALALRIAHAARAEGVGAARAIADLPTLLASDAARVQDAARGAIEDGRAAARVREQEIAEVLAIARRTEDPDD